MNNVTDCKTGRSCTGCSMCAVVCPQKAISINLSQDGFYLPILDADKCVNCGLCQKVCYKFDLSYQKSSNGNLPVCFSAVNKNNSELLSSSSGGVSIELMKQCLRMGYYVVGVAYDSTDNIAKTKIAMNESELEPFKGSKYFQSDTLDAFSNVIKDKTEQKYAIFGTPCQIYAFSKAAELQKSRDKYILVDIFCHGCPSLNLWKKYLEYSKEKYGESEFDEIKFRSKTHGWHKYCFDFKKQSKQYSSSKYSDPFYELFFSMDAMNEACYDCVARSSVEKADIRLGDFWGRRFDMDTKGVSAVVTQTMVGQRLFDAVKDKFYCESMNFNEIIAAQSYGKPHSVNTDDRLQTLSLLGSNLSMTNIIKKHRQLLPAKTKVKNLLKNGLKHLPAGINNTLKSVIHKIGD